MTEAGPAVTALSPEAHRAALAGEHLGRLESVGCAMPGVQLQIRDAQGQPVAEDAVGEVWVRGPNVMKGYLNRSAETEQVLVDGWYRTGDAGRLDAAGYLYLVDRLRDMIISGGENVYSIEVERAVGTHPQVAEVAVVGVPDERWGERVLAVVVLTPGSSLAAGDVVEHCRPLIAGYKLPSSVEIWTDPLPKSGVGKNPQARSGGSWGSRGPLTLVIAVAVLVERPPRDRTVHLAGRRRRTGPQLQRPQRG